MKIEILNNTLNIHIFPYEPILRSIQKRKLEWTKTHIK